MILLDHIKIPGFSNVDIAPGLSYQPSVGMALAFGFQIYYVLMDDFVGVSISGACRAFLLPGSCLSTNRIGPESTFRLQLTRRVLTFPSWLSST